MSSISETARPDAATDVGGGRGDAYLAVARVIAERLAAREWMSRTLTTLNNLRSDASALDERTLASLSRDEFVESYYCANKPVAFRGVATEWPASRLWTPAYLKAARGEEDVEVMANRDTVRVADQNVSDKIKTRMKFRDYLDLVYHGESTNDYYIVARNNFLASDPTRQLVRDIRWPEPVIQPDPECVRTHLWLGPAGTITSLHHDARNNLLVQVAGRKRIRLYSPLDAEYMYQHEAYYSDIDCENPDTVRFPLFQKATGIVIELEPGDGLFIPVGWWHHVRALEPSITLAFASFGLCNEFPYLRSWRFSVS